MRGVTSAPGDKRNSIFAGYRLQITHVMRDYMLGKRVKLTTHSLEVNSQIKSEIIRPDG